MLHMVIQRHTAESCPGRAGNEAIHPCLNAMQELFEEKGVKRIGGWADPPAHVSWIVVDAPTAHVITEALMESGLSSHTTTEVRPVMSMDCNAAGFSERL